MFGKEPETITISEDDDDEVLAKAEAKKKDAANQRDLPINLATSCSSSISSGSGSGSSSLSAVPKIAEKEEPQPSDLTVHKPYETRPKEMVKSAVTPTSGVDTSGATVIKKERLSLEESSEDLSMIAEALLTLSSQIPKTSQPVVQRDFETLLKGIQLHTEANTGLDMICAVTHEESYEVPYACSQVLLTNKLDVLVCVTRGDKADFEEYIDPLMLLKQQYNLHEYNSPQSQDMIQAFITKKVYYFKRQQDNQDTVIDDQEPPSLAKILKKIKNTEIMSDLEGQLRSQLVQLQDVFRIKQSELSRLKSPRKKFQKRKGSGKTSIKKQPKRLTPKRRNSNSPGLSKIRQIPHLEQSTTPPPPHLQSPSVDSWASCKASTSALLKPPKLTASLTPTKKSYTNLSTINAKFMKGKANPFALLMAKMATTGGSPVKNLPDIDEEDEEGDESNRGVAEEEANVVADADESVTADADEPVTADEVIEEEEESSESDEETADEYTFDVKKLESPRKRGRSSSLEDSASSSKKRKADKPKKQSGTTETIVPKKPKNLFMMNCYDFESGFLPKDELVAKKTTPAVVVQDQSLPPSKPSTVKKPPPAKVTNCY